MEKNKKAFTLAEVLFTLAIIGIVSMLVIPSLVVMYKQKQAVESLKKQYSTLSNVLNLATVEYGDITEWDYSDSQKFADKYLKPYMNVIKDCGTSSSDKDCDYKYSYLDGTGLTNWGGARFYLGDGTFVLVQSSKSSGEVSNVENTNWHMYRADIYVDINGRSKPNALGKDVFVFTFTGDDNNYDATTGDVSRKSEYTGKLLPKFYYNSDSQLRSQCDKTVANSGSGCTALIIKDGWKINYKW